MRPSNAVRRLREHCLTPGRFLQEKVLDPDRLTQDQLAIAMRVSRLTVNEIINERRTITIEMALRLEAATSISAEMWLNLQRTRDLLLARDRMRETLAQITRITRRRMFIDVKAHEIIEDAEP